jgi:DNA-binding response OmpR family regulator
MTKIAIIEDDRLLNDHFKGLIEKSYPNSVSQYFDRETAEKAVEAENFDLIIADIALGDHPKDKYGGISILGKLAGRSTVTLIVSGMPEENLSNIVLSLNAYDFIEKPADDLDLLNKVKHALASQSADVSLKSTSGTNYSWPSGLAANPYRNPGLLWHEKSVNLSLTQIRLVKRLIQNPGEVVEYKDLAKQLDSTKSKKAITVHLTGVRRRFRDIDPDFDQIESDPGKGYVWKTSD